MHTCIRTTYIHTLSRERRGILIHPVGVCTDAIFVVSFSTSEAYRRYRRFNRVWRRMHLKMYLFLRPVNHDGYTYQGDQLSWAARKSYNCIHMRGLILSCTRKSYNFIHMRVLILSSTRKSYNCIHMRVLILSCTKRCMDTVRCFTSEDKDTPRSASW